MINKISFILFLLCACILSAEEGNEGDVKSSVLRFDEDLKGENKKPQITTLFTNKQYDFKRIIKLRENFLPEIRSTLQTLPRD